MTLSLGTGPFSGHPAGQFNFDVKAAAPPHILYLEPLPQRIRAVVAGETILDTRRGRLLHETGLMPQVYVPFEDVQQDLLAASETSTHCPFKGDASYWSLMVGERVETDIAWSYPHPLPAAPDLAGLVSFTTKRIDAWFEEDEQMVGHIKDPYHRCDVRRSSDHVVVRIRGQVVVDSKECFRLFETNTTPRYYFPRSAIDPALLGPSETTSMCPYKGIASYHSVAGVADAAWYYPTPLPEVSPVADMLSFWGDDTEITVELAQ
jgi:uncharacterized protein (DUF427 family)